MKQLLLSRVKILFIVSIVLIGGGNSSFASPHDVTMQIIKKGAAHGGSTLMPARPWYITQDDNVLTLPALADDYTLELRDENGTVVYSTFLPAGTISVVLPSELSGEFELRLVADTYYYRGYINL